MLFRSDQIGESWEYEPTCFADEDGQWLPDFRLSEESGLCYVEVKPAYLLDRQDGESMRENVDRIDVLLRQMTIAWRSEPDAWLELIFWRYGGQGAALSILGEQTRAWVTFGAEQPRIPLLWSGMGQLDSLNATRRIPAGVA